MIKADELILKVNSRQLLANNLALTKDQEMCRLTTDTASGSTTLVVDNATGIWTDYYVIIGNFGDRTAEIRKVTVSGNTLTVAATTYDHYRDTTIIRIPYNQVAFYYSDTLTGAKTQLFASEVNVQANAMDTQIQDLEETMYIMGVGFVGGVGAFNGKNYYSFRFYNETTEEYSEYSDSIAYTGNALNTVLNIAKAGLNRLGIKIGDEFATQDEILEDIREGMDEIVHWTRPDSYLNVDWNFEIYTDTTSWSATTNEIDLPFSSLAYQPKYIASKQGIFSVVFGTKPLKYIDPDQMDEIYVNKPQTTLASTAFGGAIAIMLTSSIEFGDSGTVYVGEYAVTYTANDTDTGILSGIPATGDGSIGYAVSSGSNVWQDIEPGEPEFFTVYEDKLRLDVPVASYLAGYAIKFKYLRDLTDITSFNDVIALPFYPCLSDYTAHKIELRRRNDTKATIYYSKFEGKVNKAALTYQIPINIVQTYQHFNFELESEDLD